MQTYKSLGNWKIGILSFHLMKRVFFMLKLDLALLFGVKTFLNILDHMNALILKANNSLPKISFIRIVVQKFETLTKHFD